MTKPADYLWDKTGDADPDIARLEGLLAPLRHEAPLDELRLRRTRWLWIASGGVAAAAIAALVWWRWPSPAPQLACGEGATGFAFKASGAVSCGGRATPAGVLPVGGVLDTGAHEAELAIADIGRAELGTATRVRLDRTSAQRHQLFLERGKMHARVSAPPRIFAVATAGAAVTDLGCEYTLEVDERGAGSLVVRTGKVELDSGSGDPVVVPAGTHAHLLAGRRAGLPLVDDAAPQLVEATAAFERGAQDGVANVLAAATPSDAITVIGLSRLVPVAQRRTVLDRLAQLSAPPRGVTVDGALADAKQLAAWESEILTLLDARLFLLFK